MLAIFLAMLFIGGAIWISSYIVTNRSIRAGLDQLIRNEERVSESGLPEYYADAPSFTEVFSSEVVDATDFWILQYGPDGDLISIGGRYNEGSEKSMIMIADSIRDGKYGYGHFGRIYYEYTDYEDGEILAFIDGTAEVYALRRLMIIALIVCAAGLAVTYILVVHFSDFIVASEVENFGGTGVFCWRGRGYRRYSRTSRSSHARHSRCCSPRWGVRHSCCSSPASRCRAPR